MKQINKKAFTLIELLVVVLIIVILTAIAVPQYKKAVIQSRYNNLKLLTKSISDAQDAYFLSAGKYAESFSELDINMPSNILNTETTDERVLEQYNYDWGHCRIRRSSSGNIESQCRNDKINMGYQIELNKSRHCFVYGSNKVSDYPIQNDVCKNETGLSKNTSTGTHGGIKYVRWAY